MPFIFGVDTSPPVIDSITPQDDAYGIPVSTPINIEINDSWSGVNISSLSITISFNGYQHTYTNSAPSDSFGGISIVRDLHDNNVNVEFEPNDSYPNGTRINISVSVSDRSGNSAVYSYTFETADIANYSTFTDELEVNTFLGGTWQKVVNANCLVKWKSLEWTGSNPIGDDGTLQGYSLFQLAPYSDDDVRSNCNECSTILDNAPSEPVNFYGESGVTGANGRIEFGESTLYDPTAPFTMDLSGQTFMFMDGVHGGQEYTIVSNTTDTLILDGFLAFDTQSSINYEAGDSLYFTISPSRIESLPNSNKVLVKTLLISNASGISPSVKDINVKFEEVICDTVGNTYHYLFDTFAEELYSNRMSIYHSPDGLLHFRIYDNSKSAFQSGKSSYIKDTTNFIKNFANTSFIDSSVCDESELDCDSIKDNAILMQAAREEYCGNPADIGSALLNYRDMHSNRCNSSQRNYYEITADVSDWDSEECHLITASWRVNNRNDGACQQNNCEMHLFIDGVEVDNIVKVGTGVLYGTTLFGAPSTIGDMGIVSTRCKIVQRIKTNNQAISVCSIPRSIGSIKVIPVGLTEDTTRQWIYGENHDVLVDGDEMRIKSPEICVDGVRIDPALSSRWPCVYLPKGIFVSAIHDSLFETMWEKIEWDLDYSYNLRQAFVNDLDCAGNAIDPCSGNRTEIISDSERYLEIRDFEVRFDSDYEGYEGAYDIGYGPDFYGDGYDINCRDTENCDTTNSIDTNSIFIRMFYRVGDHPDSMGPWQRVEDQSCLDGYGYDGCLHNGSCEFASAINEAGRYIQYRAEFFSDTKETPVLKKVRLVGQPISADGFFSASAISFNENTGLREIVFRNSLGA